METKAEASVGSRAAAGTNKLTPSERIIPVNAYPIPGIPRGAIFTQQRLIPEINASSLPQCSSRYVFPLRLVLLISSPPSNAGGAIYVPFGT